MMPALLPVLLLGPLLLLDPLLALDPLLPPPLRALPSPSPSPLMVELLSSLLNSRR
jgi:hypothetical protein